MFAKAPQVRTGKWQRCTSIWGTQKSTFGNGAFWRLDINMTNTDRVRLKVT